MSRSGRLKNRYKYYSCGGTFKKPGRDRKCDNTSIRSEILEKAVWEEIKILLNNPFYLEKEYQRRIDELESKTDKHERSKLTAEKITLEKSISRLIDSYAEGIIDKTEFNPRVKNFKRRLAYIEQQLLQLIDNHAQMSELTLVLGRIEEFSEFINFFQTSSKVMINKNEV